MRFLPLAVALLATSPAFAAAELNVEVENIHDNDTIPMKHALCEATPDGKSTAGENLRPAMRWSGAPEGTQSFAVLVTDPDVPADFTDAGKDGKVVKQDAPRQLFYHWALADIPANTTSIPGAPSDQNPAFGVPAKNSLGAYLPNAHFYGGPCPPWNDERLHHYSYSVFALDVASLNLKNDATAQDLEKAMKGHVLATGNVTGTYSLNPKLSQ